MDDARLRITVGNRHAEHLKSERGFQTGGDGIADDTARVSIKNRSQVDKAAPDTDVGDVSQPYLVHPVNDRPLDEIEVSGKAVLAVSRHHSLSSHPAQQVALPHQA